MLAKFAVSLGLGWAGLELLVPAATPGHGEEQEPVPPGSLCCCRGSWGLGGPRQQCQGHSGWAVLPQVSRCSQDGVTSALCNACGVALVGGCPGHISPPL